MVRDGGILSSSLGGSVGCLFSILFNSRIVSGKSKLGSLPPFPPDLLLSYPLTYPIR